MRLYPRLAWQGIRKNKRLYLPYLLTGAGMVMMFTIIASLAIHPILNEIKGGGTLNVMLGFGQWVIAIFALIFLFYTNSFLMRRRKKEFGLYSILGMGKGNIARILFWETLFIALISIAAGMAAGALLSKLAEMGMIALIEEEISYAFIVPTKAIWTTLAIFAGIFVLLLLNSLRQLARTDPIQLLHSETYGEKPPKANAFFALVGVLLLAGAYYISLSIRQPLQAIFAFCIAVLMVILATYLIFISGSVRFCKMLQKNKHYYYKKNHFVAVSSMAYRMKRNGAGLASICILCTMVLVMISSAGTLYIGKEANINQRYPRDFSVSISYEDGVLNPAIVQGFEAALTKNENGIPRSNSYSYCRTKLLCAWNSNHTALLTSMGTSDSDTQLYILSLEDYNRIFGTDLTLEAGEAMYYCEDATLPQSLTLPGTEPLRIKQALQKAPLSADYDRLLGVEIIYLVVPDADAISATIAAQGIPDGELFSQEWLYGFDLPENTDYETHVLVAQQLWDDMSDHLRNESVGIQFFSVVSKEMPRVDFYAGYGGLFFIGIILSIVFLFAAVLIIYYKQISEGYEDQARFDIMQKVGMTKREIRKSINAQILMVFFLPLLFAGLHLGFAFPMLWRLLQLFALTDLTLLIGVTIGCFAIFGVFYAIVYRLTSNAYYAIVSGARE